MPTKSYANIISRVKIYAVSYIVKKMRFSVAIRKPHHFYIYYSFYSAIGVTTIVFATNAPFAYAPVAIT